MKNFIVFDLEWNQNPGGKEASVERLPFEIFEIGAVKLNEEREKVAEFHRIIRPCVYRQMHRIISEVTHVSIEELERDGEPFAAVMEDFLNGAARTAYSAPGEVWTLRNCRGTWSIMG